MTPEGALEISTAITAFGTFSVAIFNSWPKFRKNRIDYSAALSSSEARFREDLLTVVTNLQERLDWCEKRHRDCESRADTLETAVRRQAAEIESLRSQIQALMP